MTNLSGNRSSWQLQKIVIAFLNVLGLSLICLKFLKHPPEKQNSTVVIINESRPVIVWYTDYDGFDVTKNPQLLPIDCYTKINVIKCAIASFRKYQSPAAGYLFYGSFLDKLPLPRDKQTIWGLLHEEAPKNMPAFYSESVLNWFNFSCTFSRNSDVPMTLVNMISLKAITSKDFFVNTPTKNLLLNKIAPVIYLQSDCDTSTERDAYVLKLMNYISIDSYGRCLKNKKFPESLSRLGNATSYIYYSNSPDEYRYIAKYKFMIAIENSVCNDYVTEKFWRAINLGVVPIYYGSPLIRDWMPNNKSAILVENYPTQELLSKHLNELLQNDMKYEEHLEHKIKGLISNRRLFDEMKKRPHQTSYFENIQKFYCIMCERIHEFNTNSSKVNIVTKKHYDCPLPTTALTLSVNPNSKHFKNIAPTIKMMMDRYTYLSM